MEATSSVFAPVVCYGSLSGGRRWGLSISRGCQRSGFCASHVKRQSSLGLAGHGCGGRATKCNAVESDSSVPDDAESSEGAAKVAVSSPSDDERRNPKEEDNASRPTGGQPRAKDSLTESYLTASGFWQGVLEEIALIEWPSFQKVLGRTGVVLAIIVGSSLVLLTVNAILAELADKIINNPAFCFEILRFSEHVVHL